MFEKLKVKRARKKAIDKAYDEGKYFEYYEANPKIKNYSYRAIRDDIISETGDKRLAKKIIRSKKFKSNTKQFIQAMILIELLVTGFRGLGDLSFKYLLTDKYNSYNEFANEEINYVKENDLDTLETICYLYNDMTSYVQGYKEPEFDFISSYRCNLGENGYGVCKNFADDLTYKLNLIDEDYCAVNVVVNEKFNDYQIIFNMPQDIREKNETGNESSKEPTKLDEIKDEAKKYIVPNHMVTFAKVPDKDIVLVLDPTNAGVGVLLNGKVYMFNGNPEVIYAPVHTVLFNNTKMDYNFYKLLALSYNCPYSYEDLESMYGLNAEIEVENRLNK